MPLACSCVCIVLVATLVLSLCVFLAMKRKRPISYCDSFPLPLYRSYEWMDEEEEPPLPPPSCEAEEILRRLTDFEGVFVEPCRPTMLEILEAHRKPSLFSRIWRLWRLCQRLFAAVVILEVCRRSYSSPGVVEDISFVSAGVSEASLESDVGLMLMDKVVERVPGFPDTSSMSLVERGASDVVIWSSITWTVSGETGKDVVAWSATTPQSEQSFHSFFEGLLRRMALLLCGFIVTSVGDTSLDCGDEATGPDDPGVGVGDDVGDSCDDGDDVKLCDSEETEMNQVDGPSTVFEESAADSEVKESVASPIADVSVEGFILDDSEACLALSPVVEKPASTVPRRRRHRATRTNDVVDMSESLGLMYDERPVRRSERIKSLPRPDYQAVLIIK